jgi:hypothetical protein
MSVRPRESSDGPLASKSVSPSFSSAEKSESPSAGSIDTHVSLTSRGMIKLYGVWSVAFLATFMAGFAIATMTAIK